MREHPPQRTTVKPEHARGLRFGSAKRNNQIDVVTTRGAQVSAGLALLRTVSDDLQKLSWPNWLRKIVERAESNRRLRRGDGWIRRGYDHLCFRTMAANLHE